MPPMNTFLNRLLALRIADQNALFAAFDAILSSILERAAVLGRPGPGHGGHRRRRPGGPGRGGDPHRHGHGRADQDHHFQVRTGGRWRRPTRPWPGSTADAAVYVVNAKSRRAGLVVKGLTTTDDDDRLVPAVRIIRPEKRTIAPLKGFEELAWEAVGEAVWRAAWDAEVAEADPWHTRQLVLVTGCCCRSGRACPPRRPRSGG